MNDLVQRLSQGEHRVEVSLRPKRTLAALRQAIERGYVHVKFVDTRGGTELGLPIDPQRSDMSAANWDEESGELVLAGELTLDFVRVRCVAAIQLPAMQGEGRLELVDREAGAS